jgi:hypothetical protein
MRSGNCRHETPAAEPHGSVLALKIKGRFDVCDRGAPGSAAGFPLSGSCPTENLSQRQIVLTRQLAHWTVTILQHDRENFQLHRIGSRPLRRIHRSVNVHDFVARAHTQEAFLRQHKRIVENSKKLADISLGRIRKAPPPVSPRAGAINHRRETVPAGNLGSTAGNDDRWKNENRNERQHDRSLSTSAYGGSGSWQRILCGYDRHCHARSNEI